MSTRCVPWVRNWSRLPRGRRCAWSGCRVAQRARRRVQSGHAGRRGLHGPARSPAYAGPRCTADQVFQMKLYAARDRDLDDLRALWPLAGFGSPQQPAEQLWQAHRVRASALYRRRSGGRFSGLLGCGSWVLVTDWSHVPCGTPAEPQRGRRSCARTWPLPPGLTVIRGVVGHICGFELASHPHLPWASFVSALQRAVHRIAEPGGQTRRAIPGSIAHMVEPSSAARAPTELRADLRLPPESRAAPTAATVAPAALASARTRSTSDGVATSCTR